MRLLIVILKFSCCLVLFGTGTFITTTLKSIRTFDLESKIAVEKLPIFEFGADIKQLLEERSTSPVDAEIVFNRYLDSLRDNYFETFQSRVSLNGLSMVNCIKEKTLVLNECKVAMNAALPDNAPPHWTIDAPYNELKMDIESFISNIPEELEALKESDPNNNVFKNTVVYKRLKWLAAQTLMFAVNYVQQEVRRWMAVRAADKRLAEVPEFPLL